MPSAPTSDDELLVAAQQVVAGITANPTLWDAPPIPTATQTSDAAGFQTAAQYQVAAKAAAEQATAVKNDQKKVIKANLARLKSWAESIVGKNDPRLNELGFAAPSAGTPLAKPGQPDSVEACDEKPTGEFTLMWKKPSSGGKVAGYQILRKLPTEGVFSIHTTATSKAVSKVLTAQPLDVSIQYRLIAFNDAGDSVPSNTVEVKL